MKNSRISDMKVDRRFTGINTRINKDNVSWAILSVLADAFEPYTGAISN